MIPVSVNWAAVVVCSVLSLGLGFLWMTKIFARPYGKHMYGVTSLGTPESQVSKKQQASSFVIYILVSLITSYVFGLMVFFAKTSTEGSFAVGMMATLMVWAGFFLPFAVNKAVWQMKSWVVVAIDASYELVRLIMMLFIFWYWQS